MHLSRQFFFSHLNFFQFCIVNDWKFLLFVFIFVILVYCHVKRYMLCGVVDGKIVDNWVMVDFPHVMAQLGVDAFNGEGWEAYDRGERQAPRPKSK